LSSLLNSSQNSDMEVDIVGAVIDVSPALSNRYLLFFDGLFFDVNALKYNSAISTEPCYPACMSFVGC